ncbi:MAG: vitamin K epoxide reductase family protein [Candidatus Caenarcaniphilales bacterium]|nr:vitamin K epoxide reductase family protein [Candidatus Caenarcaniphilales bacterium]
MQDSPENSEIKNKDRIPLIPYMLLGVLIINSAFLSYKYINFYYFRDILMDINGLACSTDCDAVMLSKFAILFGIPTPVYGLVAFILLSILFFKVDNSSNPKLRRNFELLLGTCCIFALIFIYVMYFKLELICKFCMLSHIATFLFTGYYFTYYKTQYIDND